MWQARMNACKSGLELIGLQVGYWIAKHLFKNFKGQQFFLDSIKLLVFELGGACRHSGNCCRSLKLSIEGRSIETLTDYQQYIKPQPHLKSFIPQQGSDGELRFSCQLLSADNKCLDYNNRPNLCRNYPMSYFLEFGQILDDCGYYVRKRQDRPYIFIPEIQRQIDYINQKNRL